MVPSAADAENADGGSGDKGKSKTPSMYRTIKSRLQKLVDKADDTYALPIVFLRYNVHHYQRSYFIHRVHGVAVQERMAALLQANKAATMLGKYICESIMIPRTVPYVYQETHQTQRIFERS